MVAFSVPIRDSRAAPGDEETERGEDLPSAARRGEILGVLAMTVELGEFGITANYIRPGAIVTGITRDVFAADAAFRSFWEQKAALKRLGQPEDIANAIAFLASDEAAFITGHGLLVDGGALQSP